MKTGRRDQKWEILQHLNLLRKLGLSDGDYSPAEDRFIRNLATRLGLSEKEIDSFFSQAVAEPDHAPREESRRREQLLDLVELMLADGEIDATEREMVREVSRRFGFAANYADALTEQVVSRQRLSHLNDLITIASSDGEFCRLERRVLLEVARIWGVTADELQRVLTQKDTIRDAWPLSEKERGERLLDLAMMAWADGRILPAERKVGRLISGRMGLLPERFDELLDQFEIWRKQGVHVDELRDEARGWLQDMLKLSW